MYIKTNPDLRGDLKITETNLITGETSVVVDEKNIIVRTGIETIPKALSPKIMTGGKLGVIKFGDDVGNGTQLKPQPPLFTDSAASQNVVYTVPSSKMNYTPDGGKLILSISMNGADVVGNKDYIRYTSAAIYTDSGEMFSFKRFPFRVFSKHVRVNIEWIITAENMEEQGGGETCPPLPFVIGVVTETSSFAMEVGEKVTVRGYERLNNGALQVVPNGSKWTTSNSNINLSSGPNGTVVVNGMTSGSTYITLTSGDYSDSKLLTVVEKSKVKDLYITTDTIGDINVGDTILFKAVYSENGVPTDVSYEAGWTTSSNLKVLSKTNDGLMVEVIGTGVAYVTAEHEDLVTQYDFEVIVPKMVSHIEIIPLGDLRFDVGETLDITPMIYYNDGTSRLGTISDRWVYDARAIKLEEHGTVGNLRITGLYRGDWNIRLYDGGVEGKLEFKIAQPIKVMDVYTFPQTPLYVIPDIYNLSTVMGELNEGEDTRIDPFYIESNDPKLIVDEVGIKVSGTGSYTMRVVVDEVDKELTVISTEVSGRPLKLTLCDCDGVGSGTIKLELINPKEDGVTIDHNGSIRRFYADSGVVEIDYYPEDKLTLYGGVETLKITGGLKEIEQWGDFDCDGYEIESQALIAVPYVAPNVKTMDRMFKGSTMFNQNLSAWCVTEFDTKPLGFDEGCVSWMELRPIWGTCPDPHEIYKVVINPSDDITLAIGGKTSLEVFGVSRMDEKVLPDGDIVKLEYNDSIVFVTQSGDNTEVEGLTAGTTTLKVIGGEVETSIEVEVE